MACRRAILIILDLVFLLKFMMGLGTTVLDMR